MTPYYVVITSWFPKSCHAVLDFSPVIQNFRKPPKMTQKNQNHSYNAKMFENVKITEWSFSSLLEHLCWSNTFYIHNYFRLLLIKLHYVFDFLRRSWWRSYDVRWGHKQENISSCGAIWGLSIKRKVIFICLITRKTMQGIGQPPPPPLPPPPHTHHP